MVKIYIKSIGCKVNQAEAEEMMKLLIEEGAERADNEKNADVCIINTCTVTQRADADSRNAIRRAIKNNPSSKVIVAGCYSKLYPEKVFSIDGVDIVVGNKEKQKIAKIIECAFEGKRKIIASEDNGNELFLASSHSINSTRTRAFLKIQDGCDSACSYCVVPLARGKSRSASLEETVNAFQKLLEEGYKEIVLTGIHLGDFGKDRKKEKEFEGLLSRLAALKGDFRIRLSSIEPREISNELIELIASTDKIAPHLHIPLQSGDDRILSLMNRNYDTKFFEKLIDKICLKIDHINIGLDVIAGFPSESEKEFQNTYNFIKSLPAGYLHVFSYSDRQGTKASQLPNKVSSQKIKERADKLRNLSKLKKGKFRAKFIGRRMRILAERKIDGSKNRWKGLTDNYIPVSFEADSHLRKNQFLNVVIKGFGKDEIMEGKFDSIINTI